MSDNESKSKNSGSSEAGSSVSQHIIIKVEAAGREDVKFSIKMTTKLGKLMHSYCEGMKISMGQTRFFFDGRRVLDSHTPKELGMEDGDVIEMFSEQLGGNQNSLNE